MKNDVRQVATVNSSSQRRMHGHHFVVLEHHLHRSRINVRFMPRRTSLNHGSNHQKYNSISKAFGCIIQTSNPWGFLSSEIICKFHQTKIS